MTEPSHNPEDWRSVRRPRKLGGFLVIMGIRFPFVSGGAGWSIPYGHYPIDDSVGRWGARHGALGLNGGTIYDVQLGRDRDGIEIHEQHHGATAGCVGISDRFRELKVAIAVMVETFGGAFLHITPAGATITPWKIPVVMAGEVEERDDDAQERKRGHAHVGRHHRVRYAHRRHQRVASL